MRNVCLLVLSIVLLACHPQSEQSLVASDSDTSSSYFIQYSEKDLWTFLDSVGNADLTPGVQSLRNTVDSVLEHPVRLHKILRKLDYEKLKTQLKEEAIDLELALRIFPLLEFDSSFLIQEEKYKLPVMYIPFQNGADEFAVAIGHDGVGRNDVYFFKGNKILAKHNIYHRYGLDLKFLRDEAQQLIVYYKVNYGSGTGIWWHQYNFYRYEKEQLRPVLTEIQNINLQFPWSIRAYWIQASVVNERPLKIKFVYNNQFYDTLALYDFIDDSTIVTYYTNTTTGMYEADFTNSSLNPQKLLSYFHADNELLFIQAHYGQFKEQLTTGTTAMKQAILDYLNEVKNRQEIEK
jgi:hypothetical protein